jgi:hypothetical protein
MRLTTRGATTFELDPESYSKMMAEVRQLVTELLTDQISTDMVASVTRKVLDTVNYEHIAQYAGMNLDYSRVVDYARRWNH